MPKPAAHKHGPGCGHATTAADSKRELQKKYIQFQLTQQYVAALSEERASLEAKLAELAMTGAAMVRLKEIKQGEEMWSTLGSDVFVMSDIKDISTAIVGVGAGVYVRKPLEEAIKTIDNRRAELAAVNKQLVAEINALNAQLVKLQPEMQAIAAQLQAQEKK